MFWGRGMYGPGPGYWGFGRGLGNPTPFCRFHPWLPKRWWAGLSFPVGAGVNEASYLKNYAEALKAELGYIERRLQELKAEE